MVIFVGDGVHRFTVYNKTDNATSNKYLTNSISTLLNAYEYLISLFEYFISDIFAILASSHNLLEICQTNGTTFTDNDVSVVFVNTSNHTRDS